MNEIIMTGNVVVDDVEAVLAGLTDIMKREISSIETIKRFVTTEKNTYFYLDDKLNCKMAEEKNAVYLWLDTGYVNYNGNPVFISLLKENGMYKGHVVGTSRTLADSARSFFHKNAGAISKNVPVFNSKYEKKIECREHKHIEDEVAFLVDKCNESTELEGIFALKFRELGMNFDNVEAEEIVEAAIEEEVSENPVQFTKFEEEITVSILLDQMDVMQSYVDELLATIETMSNESLEMKERFEALQAKSDEYNRAMLQMRGYLEDEDRTSASDDESAVGHNLLGNHKKILVIGGEELGENVMQGIAKQYGFDKKDFDFVEYDKAKDYAERVRRDGKYSAVIIGACPHKVSALGYESSMVTKLKNISDLICVEARSKAGELKLTKESFRAALCTICANLRLACA